MRKVESSTTTKFPYSQNLTLYKDDDYALTFHMRRSPDWYKTYGLGVHYASAKYPSFIEDRNTKIKQGRANEITLFLLRRSFTLRLEWKSF